MAFTPEEQKIFADVSAYAVGKDFILNPDTAVVERVVKGLAARAAKTGFRYCPCRLMTKIPEKDKDIICPCVFHPEEIARDGECHCQLYVRAPK